MRNDGSLWVVRHFRDIPEIIQWLIEEPPFPLEYHTLVDAVGEYISSRKDLESYAISDAIDVIAMQLEGYQVMIDDIVTKGQCEDVLRFEYEVVRWLGSTTAAIAVRDFDDRRYPLFSFKNI